MFLIKCTGALAFLACFNIRVLFGILFLVAVNYLMSQHPLRNMSWGWRQSTSKFAPIHVLREHVCAHRHVATVSCKVCHVVMMFETCQLRVGGWKAESHEVGHREVYAFFNNLAGLSQWSQKWIHESRCKLNIRKTRFHTLARFYRCSSSGWWIYFWDRIHNRSLRRREE